MSGVVRRPVHSNRIEGRAATTLVLLVILALLAGCGGAAPSSGVSASPASGASGLPPTTSAPAGTPSPSAEPGGTWVSGVQLPPAQAVASLEPTKEARAGVLADTAFRLRALDGSDPVALARRLTSDPRLRLRVEAADGAALVRPVEPLEPGQRYHFVLTAPDGTIQGSWAVQSVAPLAVVGTTPGEQSTDVPVTTGIEVAFNQYGVDLDAATPFIKLAPSVRGHFEQAGKTIAFVPDRPLAPATLYTLTVRAGLPLAGTPMRLDEDVVARFETAGPASSGPRVTALEVLVEARPTDRAVIPLYVDRYWSDGEGSSGEYAMPRKLAVTVHRLDNLASAVDAWRSLSTIPDWTECSVSAPVATRSLPEVLSTTLRIKPRRSGSDYASVQLPAPLGAGWYVITTSQAADRAQVVLQVTDLAVYTVMTKSRTVAWVNDLRTGGPVDGAAASVDGSAIGRTDAKGVVVGRTPSAVASDESPSPVLVVRAGRRGVFVPGEPTWCRWCGGPSGTSPYRLVLEPDRYVYRSTDTVNTWGVVRSRGSGAVPERVRVRLAAWSDESASTTAIASRAAKPDRNGVFLVRFPVRDLPYGDYSLVLEVNGESVAERSISVAPIEKPAWRMELRTSKQAVLDGAKVTATVNARFFEGTPVAGARIDVESGDARRTLRTNASGTGSALLPLRLSAYEGQWSVVSLEARPTLPEEAEIAADCEGNADCYVAVFRATVIVKADAVVDRGRLVVSGSVHDVAFERFEHQQGAWLEDVDPYGPTRSGVRVRVRVVEHVYRQRKVRTEYDWILKRAVPVYETTESTRDLGDRILRTDASGRYRVTLPAAGRDRGYEVSVRAVDAEGRMTTDSAWADAVLAHPEEDDQPYLDLSNGDEPVSVGETVTVRFGGGSGAGRSTRYLWTVARAGLRDTAITSAPRYAITYRAADIPALYVRAVRFNGLAYEVVPYEQRVEYRLADRALTVDVRPDRARYAPGGHATLAIRTTDAAGRPVAASVYVGVVDEKLAALGLVNEADPLFSLYDDGGSGILGIGWTHRDPWGSEGEGGDTAGGGGDDGGARSDFRDWLVARIVRTGSDGRGTVGFDLSDDLTSWRVFAAAVGRSLLAGTGGAKLPVSLPFFAELTVAESYLVADRPVVRVRAYGTGLDGDETVTFTVSSDTLGLAPVTVRAAAFEAAEVALPALTVGNHRIRVEAVTGSGDTRRRDALVRSFSVVATRAVQASVTSAPLDGPTGVTGGQGLTTILLGDAGRGRVIPMLEELSNADPVRGDRALAAGIATRALRDTFGIEPEGDALDLDLSVFQESGGYAVLRYGDPDLELSALAAMSGDPRVAGSDEDFPPRRATTREEAIWILVRAASTGRPVLSEIRAMAALGDLTVAERVALADAAIAAGDEDLAGTLLRAILRDAGEHQGPWVRVLGDKGDDQGAVLTARLAIVAARLGEPVAGPMDDYLAANPPATTVVDLERALAAQGWVERVPAADAAAALTVGGTRTEIRIRASRPVTVSLTQGQVETARLEPVSGSVLVTTRSDRPLDPSLLEAPDWLRPVRTVRPAGQIDLADTIVVTIRVTPPLKASHGCLNVTEYAPSGLVPIARTDRWIDDEEGERRRYTRGPWSILGQRVDFCVDPDPKGGSVTLRYAARVVTPGSYLWEPTVVQSVLMPEVGTVIPASRVTIDGLP